MATCTATRGTALLRAALLVTTGLVLFVGSPAWARVGVTSGADGDPLGKPPNENERILRIGIDVQADEVITTAANDRAHLVFLDGSSLTVGPDARLTIDRFVFDPATQKGDLAINATKGVFRLVGGKISKSNAIVIKSPASTIGIRGGITIFSVNQNQTIADFIFGYSMTVTAGGQTQTANRAGSQIVTNAGGVPGVPTLLKPGSLTAALGNLEGAKSNGNNGADQSAEKSGFSNKNSGQPANAPTFNQNLPPNTNNNTLTSAVSFSNPAGQPVGNSSPQNQPKTNTVPTTNTITITSTVVPVIPNTTPTAPIPPANNNPPAPPSGPTTTTQTGFAAGWVVIDQPRSEDDRHSRRVTLLSQPGTVSITTNSANNQAIGTLKVGVSDPHNPANATLQLSGISTGTAVVMHNDSSRPSTLQIGDRTYPISPTSVLAGTSGTCTCEFLSFGAWASSVADPRHSGNTLTAYGTYVAGTPTTAIQMPQIGSATYNGVMLGNVNGSPSITSGSYQMGWNFANRAGNFSGNFDGRAYNGPMSAVAGSAGVNFAGPLSGGNRSGSVNGSFFGDGAKNQGGVFSIGGAYSRYQATGIFAGQR